MAHALTDRLCRRRVFVASVGLEPGRLDPFSIAAMAEIGQDISAHRPQSLSAAETHAFDLVIALAPEAKAPAARIAGHMKAAFDYWPIPDPTRARGTREQRLESYRDARDRLAERIRQRFAAFG